MFMYLVYLYILLISFVTLVSRNINIFKDSNLLLLLLLLEFSIQFCTLFTGISLVMHYYISFILIVNFVTFNFEEYKQQFDYLNETRSNP